MAAPSVDRLRSLVDAMEDRPVPIIADLVADRFITGTPKRISREAPVLILSWEGEHVVPGGGANAVANVAALGGRPIPFGWVGDDEAGRQLNQAFVDRGIDPRGILVHPGYRTPTKTRILGGGRHAIKQQIVRYDIEDQVTLDEPLREQMATRLSEVLGAEATAPTVAVLSDYGYGAVEPFWVEALRDQLGTSSAILCDSRYRLRHFEGIDGATPNMEEAETLHGGPLGEPSSGLEANGEALRQALDAHFLLITRGSDGMTLLQGQQEVAAHLPVHGTDQVADVTGAGDTVIGTFALALAAGAKALEAAILANYAGGVVVMKMGTATLSPQELHQAISNDPDLPRRIRWASC
ncbi:MAG: PfkB family carbohydrate kinase [Acidobacteriota bacterium]